MNKLVTMSLVLSLTATLMACGDKDVANETETAVEDAQVAVEDTVAEAQAPIEAVSSEPFLTNADALQKAEDSLKALPQFEGKPLNLFQNVVFSDHGNGAGRIMLEVQDPNNEENIDHYEYDAETATWSEPQPVQISGGGDMSANVTPLSDIKFTDIPNVVVPMWHAKAEENSVEPNEASPDGVTMVLWVPDQHRFWQTSMETPRASYFLRVNLDGTLDSFKKN